MKGSTILLGLISVIGISYSIYKLFTGQGGGGLGDFFDALGYTSIILFLASLAIIVINYRQLRQHYDTFLFLLLGLPMTVMSTGGLVESINYNRTPDLTPKYSKPVSQEVFSEDSMRIVVQVDSLVAIRNRETGGIKVSSAFIDTIIYSQSGKEIFVVYVQQFEPNHLGNNLDPAYLSADERDSIYWHLREGTPNAEQMSGSFHNVLDLKNAVRKFYFNQYSFLEKDSTKKNYFWK